MASPIISKFLITACCVFKSATKSEYSKFIVNVLIFTIALSISSRYKGDYT